jgi:hypothetical protein
MQKYHFEKMFPDQSVLADPGERYDHLTALNGKDWLLVYTWNGRRIVLNPGQLPGNQYSINWYSPANGTFLQSGQVKKGDKFEFDPPSETKDGNDWVLILIQFNGSKPLSVPLPILHDSSFTPYLTWLKIKKEFLQAKIIETRLPAGLKTPKTTIR